MKLKYTILYVEDVAKTLDFYVAAFGMEIGFMHESGDYGELKTGTTTLSFSSLQLMKDIGKPAVAANSDAPCFEIGLETEDVAQALKKALTAGAALVQDVEEMPWGQTTAYVNDINGFLVEICSPVNG